MRDSILSIALTGALVLGASPVLADWTLDPERSAVTYVTIKSTNIPENNHFKEMRGQIDATGQVVVTLMLDSVETLVPIRNERMREILFDTASYKDAELKARIDPKALESLPVGQIQRMAAEGQLTLHGQSQTLTLSMMVGRLDADTLMVAGTEPLLIEASKFGLSESVEKLRAIAGLPSISEAVPVVFVVTFTQTAND
ncbi:YceI family protein [Allochromatium vinosum]|uniref:YceI family protein n=1 Tax=Allochromatium vinosum (strain ATCC 17899 / DSM 180 / NBRC 103801 / NCIMB 10441 / D) TaxID=572477 RepID=D3RT93_ALLVD|nr:YceI family protein [Allochromatium vinosum]ADC62402.1 YceI family protein [Allochromatium vinosum DSM 180]